MTEPDDRISWAERGTTPAATREPDPPSPEPEPETPAPEPAPEPKPEPAPAPEPEPEPDPEPQPPPKEPEPTGKRVRIEVLCRDAVGLVPPTGGGRSHKIRRLSVHHTARRLGSNAQAPARLRGWQQFHFEQGWNDIAYHYAVDLAGNTYELRSPSLAGDTMTNYDPTGHFLVVCEGNYSEQTPTDATLGSVAELLAWASQNYGVSLDTVAGHRDYAATACPGNALYAKLAALRTEAASIVKAGGAKLDVVCGSDAAARVAAIERG